MSLTYKYAMRKKHIARKKRICKRIYGFEWYHNGDGHYNKGKIHCSCPLCAVKTNDRKLIKSRGPINSTRRICRYETTHNRYGRKNWTISDRRKIDNMNEQLNELTDMEIDNEIK